METNQTIDITAEERETVLTLLQRHLPGVEAWTYGSRAKSTAHPQSDLDLVVFATPEQSHKISDLREALEESNLPFRVDLFVWDEVPEQFHQEIKRDHVVLATGNGETPEKEKLEVDEWCECMLTDACRAINYGLTASATDDQTGLRFLRITDIVSGHIDWKTVPRVIADAKTIDKYRLYDGDIVLARTGASTGASAYVKAPPLSVFASYLVRLQPKPNFDGRFLSYYLKSNKFWSFIRGVSGDKSAQPNASASTMTQAPLLFPRRKEEQKAIAHILGTLDDKIELNRRTNETLEAMARALFKSWFIDFDPVRAKMTLKHHSPLEGESNPQNGFGGGNNDQATDPDLPPPHQSSPDGSPSATPPQGGSDWTVERARAYLARMDPEVAALFPDKLVDSELGEIPEGWEVFCLKDLAVHHTQSISPYRTNEFFAHYSIPAYDSGQIPAIDVGTDIKSNKTLIPDDAVLLSKLNPEIPRIWIPEMVSRHQQICSTEFLVFTPKPLSNQSLLFSLFTETNFRNLLQSMVTGTSKSHQRVPAKDLKQQQVLSGACTIFDRFEEITNPILKLVIDNRIENRAISSLRDTLLPKLISGELRVDDKVAVEAAV